MSGPKPSLPPGLSRGLRGTREPSGVSFVKVPVPPVPVPLGRAAFSWLAHLPGPASKCQPIGGWVSTHEARGIANIQSAAAEV